MTVSKYKAVCIFASPRTGSTLLVEQLTIELNRQTGVKAKAFYEYLSPHNYINDSTLECTYIDREHVLRRPFTNGIDLDRLERLDEYYKRNIVPVWKLFQQDISPTNRVHISRYVLNDHSVYKICLNRLDVVNQIISYCIGLSTGIWHSTKGNDSIENKIWRQYHVEKNILNEIGSSIMLHYLWHAENAHKHCHKIVWYHGIDLADWSELGITQFDITASKLIKNTTDHITLGRQCILNFEEVHEYAKMIAKNLKQISENLR
jgi:LPS sulfotransferase NodH